MSNIRSFGVPKSSPKYGDPPIIDSPPMMFGGYIESASLSIGYGANSSTCQLTLVYEKDGPLRGDFNPENYFPELGTAVGFKFGECTFGGIFQRYTNKKSTGGYKWDIIIEAPGKWLDGIQIILDGFQGNRYTTNGVLGFGDKDGVFTNQLNNIWNPFACREYFLYNASDKKLGVFGGSQVNSAGFPAVDALQIIQRISQGKESFGGKAVFGNSEYEVDLTEVIKIIPPFFRLKGPIQSLSGIIQECCDIAMYDYIVFIEPKNSLITTNGVIENPVIKIKVVNKGISPDSNVIKQFITSYEKSNKLISADVGKEFNEAVTQRLVIGGQASRYLFVDGGGCFPVWGKLSNMGPIFGYRKFVIYDESKFEQPLWAGSPMLNVNSAYTFGYGLGPLDQAPIVLKDSNSIYLTTVLEVRCAMASFDTWMLYKLLTDKTFPGFSNVRIDPVALQKLQLGTATVNEILNSTIATQQFFNNIYSGVNITEELNTLHSQIKQAGEEFYGRKFLVPLPVEGQSLSNNIKWLSEDQAYISSWKTADSAWSDDFMPFLDVAFYDGDGRLRTTATWNSNNRYDYSSLGGAHAQDLYVGGVGTYSVNYLQKDIMFYRGIDPGLAAYVIVDVPPVNYYDDITTDNYGFFHLLKIIKNINAHPNIMQSFGNENGPLSHKIAPARVKPVQFGIPQESTRYTWGPWWWSSSKKGKAEVVIEPDLKPETFGSSKIADQVGFSYAYIANANVGGVESGYVELAEIPTYNLANRFADSGPYITNIDINIGMDGVKTTYKFNTWTPQFGKLAKYNADRIARINKNFIRFLQEQRSQFDKPPLPSIESAKSIFSTPNMGAMMFGMHSMNMTFGQLLQGPDKYGKSPTSKTRLRPNVQRGNISNGLAGMAGNMSNSAGCSEEQIQTPIIIPRDPEYTLNTPGFTKPKDPIIVDKAFQPQYPKGPGDIQQNQSGPFGRFWRNHVGPTNKNLNPYYTQGSNDFQLAVFDSSTNFNLQENNPNEIRTLGMRGPLLLSGWGYGLDDTCVPPSGTTKIDDLMQFNSNAGIDRSLWKSGPVHLMWDEERQVWAGGPQIVEGILNTDIIAAKNVNSPTNFNIKLRRTSQWLDSKEQLVCTNRDPKLAVKAAPDVLIIVVRINYEWRPIWISCKP